jgi:adenine-specific DNA methylase
METMKKAIEDIKEFILDVSKKCKKRDIRDFYDDKDMCYDR